MKTKSQSCFLEEMTRKFGDAFNFSEAVYHNRDAYITVLCNKCRTKFTTKPRYLVDKNNASSICPCCKKTMDSRRKTLTQDEFVQKSRRVHGEKYSYEQAVYSGCNSPVKIWCTICNKMFIQKPRYHLGGAGCQLCWHKSISIANKITQTQFIQKAIDFHGNKYSYTKSVYVGGRIKVVIKCNRCKRIFKMRPDAHLRGGGCLCETDSIGEMKIISFCKKNNILFERNKTFDGCKRIRPLHFDFYFQDMNLLVEYDGRQHFSPFFSDKLNEEQAGRILLLQKEADFIKSEFANKNGIRLIRIPYTKLKHIDVILFDIFHEKISNCISV